MNRGCRVVRPTGEIRIRAAIAVVQDGRILLVPHLNTEAGPTRWVIPGGKVEFGESVWETAVREFCEKTGLRARVASLLDVSEFMRPEKPWHSITITFLGQVIAGELAPEPDHRCGRKAPRWFSRDQIGSVPVHPLAVMVKALATRG